MKEKMELIKQKILSGIYDFTQEEIILINSNSKLKKILEKELEENEWTKNYEKYESYGIEFTNQMIYRYIEAEIKFSSKIQIDDLKGCLEFITNEEIQKKSFDMINEDQIKNPGKYYYDIVESGYIEKILDNKEYDKLTRIDLIALSNDKELEILADRIYTEFPFEQYNLNELLKNNSIITRTDFPVDKIKYLDEENFITLIIKTMENWDSKIDKNLTINTIREEFNKRLENPEKVKSFFECFDENGKTKKDKSFPEIISQIYPEILDLVCSNLSTTDIYEKMKKDELSYQFVKKICETGSLSYILDDNNICDIFFERGDYKALLKTSSEYVKNKFHELIKIKEERLIKFVNDEQEYIEKIEAFDLYDMALENKIIKKLLLSSRKRLGENSMLKAKYIKENPNIEITSSGEILTQEAKALLETKRYDIFGNPLFLEYDFIEYCLKELPPEEYIPLNILTSMNFVAIMFSDYELLQKAIDKNELMSLYLIKKNMSGAYRKMIKYDKAFYEKSKKVISEVYEYDIKKMDLLVEKCGYNLLNYLDNSNFIKILEMPIEKIEKILNLFPIEEFKLGDVEGVYDSVKQYNYSKKHPEVIMIFSNIIHSIYDNDGDYKKMLLEIIPYMNDEYFKMMESKYSELKDYIISSSELFEEITRGIINNSNDKQKYLNMLHDTTDYYIARKREEARNDYDMYGEINIPFVLIKTNVVNYLSDYYLTEKNKYLIPSDFYESIIDENISSEILNSVIEYLRNPENYEKEDIEEIKKYISKIKQKARNAVKEDVDQTTIENYKLCSNIHKYAIATGIKEGKIKKCYLYNQKDIDLCEFISKMNIELINDKLLSDDEEIYKELTELMEKKKPHLIPEYLKDFLSDNGFGISYDDSNIISFIEYFYKIRKESKCATITDILNIGKAYGYVSSIYSLVLGEEDARIIAENPSGNAATKKCQNDERLKEALDWTIKIFERQEVTIPPFDEMIVNEEKSIRCVAANFTNPSNLTHGERTGSCMRIGGAGESLFYFALNNKNGFHIRFENPETGEYISRVTGFRNGNTVFLNELRNSLDPNQYSDEEIIEFTKQAARMIIKMSKNSTMPIDNVVVHKAYATSTVDEDSVLKITHKDIKEGLPAFYSDVGTRAIVLATSNEDNSLVPINFDKTKVPTYQPVREIPKCSEDEIDLISRVNRVHAINTYLKTGTFSSIEPITFENGFKYGYANQDWYIYVDNDNQIHEEIIDIDKRAKKELEYVKEDIIKKIEYPSIRGEIK